MPTRSINSLDPRYERLPELRQKRFIAGIINDFKLTFKSFFNNLFYKLNKLEIANYQSQISSKEILAEIKKNPQETQKLIQSQLSQTKVLLEQLSAMETLSFQNKETLEEAIEAIRNINIEIPQVKIPENVSINNFNQLEIPLRNLEKVLGKIFDKEIKFPPIQQIKGLVTIEQLPKLTQLSDVIFLLENVNKQLTDLKAVKPADIKIPSFPKEIKMAQTNQLINLLESVRKELAEIKDKKPSEFPQAISVDNFPIQKYPMPVTQINILPLNGAITTTATTVTTIATKLPATAAESRRTIIVYNNDATATLFLGGVNLTTANGLPIPPESYSPPFDAGVRTTLYGIVSSGSINVRVLEIAMETDRRETA